MKLFNKVSILFASLALVMGAGLVGSNDAKEVKAEDTWNLVTDASTLAVGDKIFIAAKNVEYALSTNGENNRTGVDITKDTTNKTATLNDNVQILTLETGSISNSFAFYTGDGYLYAASSSKNQLKTGTTLSANSSWTITIASASSGSAATIKAQGKNTRNLLRYNSSSNLFSCYSSGQAEVVIYKLDASVITADQIISLIEKIGDVSLKSKDAIDAARKAYDKADSAVKSEVDKAESNNTATLEAAEKKYNNLVEANTIDTLITSIGTVKYTKESKTLIDEAKNKYDAAKTEVKELVSKVDILESAIKEYARLENLAKENAKIVSDEIDNLPTADEITDVSKKTEIDKVKADYDKLSEEEKTLVDSEKVNKLNSLLDKLATFQKELVAVSSGTLNNTTFATKTNECSSKSTSYYGVYNGNYIYTAKYVPATIENLTISYEISIATYGGTDSDQTISIGAYFNEELVSNLDKYTAPKNKDTMSGTIVLKANTQLFELRIISNNNSTDSKFVRIYDASFSYFYNDSVVKFASDWAAMRTDGGVNGICEFLKSGTEKRDTLDYMLAGFDNLTNSDELANYNDGDSQTSILDSINYVKSIINGEQKTDGDYGINSGVIITSNYSIDSTSLIALFALLGIGAISAYYFIEKKKLSK